MIYLTSDTHFNHDKPFIYEPRGFHSVQEMNETLFRNWNNTVTDEDDVYMLGDFFLGTDSDFVKETLKLLRGKIHIIIGNHDTGAKCFIYEHGDHNVVDIQYATIISYKKRQFYLSHYPTLTADLQSNPEKVVFNIFGHTHSKEKFYEGCPYMYNAAVDANDNKPVSIEEIYNSIMDKISPK
jgi:calcineurin-like phosphoesterase family protein